MHKTPLQVLITMLGKHETVALMTQPSQQDARSVTLKASVLIADDACTLAWFRDVVMMIREATSSRSRSPEALRHQANLVWSSFAMRRVSGEEVSPRSSADSLVTSARRTILPPSALKGSGGRAALGVRIIGECRH